MILRLLRKKQPFFLHDGFPYISADGMRIVYTATENGHEYVIQDTIKSQPYESIISFNNW